MTLFFRALQQQRFVCTGGVIRRGACLIGHIRPQARKPEPQPRPARFPRGDNRIKEYRKEKRVYVCDECGRKKRFRGRVHQWDGRYLDDTWRDRYEFWDLADRWKRGLEDFTWLCTECHGRRRGLDMNATRNQLGIGACVNLAKRRKRTEGAQCRPEGAHHPLLVDPKCEGEEWNFV